MHPDSGQFGFSKLSRPITPIPASGPVIDSRMVGDQPRKRRRSAQKKLNVQEVLKMLYRGRWLILGTFLIVFAYTVYTTYSKPFIYASSTKMFIEKPPAAAQLKPLATDDDHSVANIIQFFRSHIVGKHVAHLIHSYAQGDRREIDSLYREYFGSTAAIPSDPKLLTITRVVDNPKERPIPGYADELMIEGRAASAVSIIPDQNNDYLVVGAEAYTPLDAAFIVNTYVVVFATDQLARARSNAAELKDFLNEQKQRSYDTLYQVESKLKNYLMATNGLSMEARAGELSTQLEQTKLKLANINIDIAQQRKIHDDLVVNLDTAQKNYFSNLTLDPYIQMLQGQLASAQVELEQMMATNAVMDPRTKKYVRDDIKAKEEKIATLNEKLKEKAQELLHSKIVVVTEVNQERNSVQTNTSNSGADAITHLKETILATQLKVGQNQIVAAELSKLIASIQSELSAMPEKIIQAAQLKRAQSSAEKLYSSLEDRYMDAWLSERSVFGSVKLEDAAALNPAPIRPNRQAAIFSGSLIGLAVGIGLVIFLSFLDTTIRSPEELESQGLPVLSTIPVITLPQIDKIEVAGKENVPKFTAHRITHLDPRSTVAEAYRSLRTSIQYAGLDKPIHTMVITSSAPQEGKSTTSSNIAIVMAQLGKRTLLVDTDLRRPVINGIYGLEREPGLTNVLFNRISLDEAVKPTDVENLFILPCGVVPPNPAELLGSVRMKVLIEEMKSKFDLIIFDTPPVIAVTDAVLLGMNTDAMLVIARADVTKSDALMRGIDSIERTGAKVLGVVLNNFNVAHAYGSYYRYYQYYHYYSMDKAPKQDFLSRLMMPGKRIFRKKV